MQGLIKENNYNDDDDDNDEGMHENLDKEGKWLAVPRATKNVFLQNNFYFPHKGFVWFEANSPLET